MKIALGTVQFGMDYGVAKPGKQTPEAEVSKILELGKSNGISMLDTATSYGNSEAVLGQIGICNWDVVSKISNLPETDNLQKWIRDEIEGSLYRLDIDQLYGILIHEPERLNAQNEKIIFDTLNTLKEERLVKKTGVSIYSPEELSRILALTDLDLIQAPVSLIDRRLETSGWIERLDKNGIEIHARSVFLQGLLLLSAQERPEKFSRWGSLWKEYDDWLHDSQITNLQACLSYIHSVPGITKIIVGVNESKQLSEILNSIIAFDGVYPAQLSSKDPFLVNPSFWQRL